MTVVLNTNPQNSYIAFSLNVFQAIPIITTILLLS